MDRVPEDRSTRRRVVAIGDARVLCVDDTHRLLSFGLRERGWSVTNWNRFTRRDRRGAPWPPAVRLPFDAATIRLPPTKAAFAMAATAVAARVKAGGIVWVYGADREGVRGCASDLPTGLFERCVVVHTENQKPDGSSSDGSPHGSSHVEDSTGGFAALRCVRTDRDPSADVAADDESGFKSRSNLRLELPGHRAHDVDGWVTYPGLFAGGGLDVMTDFLLQTMTASKTCALGGGGGGNGGDEVLSALDFCSGSGTLAAAVRFVRPSRASHVAGRGRRRDARRAGEPVGGARRFIFRRRFVPARDVRALRRVDRFGG